MKKLTLFLLVVFVIGCASKPPRKPLVDEKDPKDSYEQKYKTIDEFVKWLVEGESGKSTGAKVKAQKATAMKAKEGATVKIDNKDMDCYLYDTEDNWKFFDTYLTTISSGSEISNFYNVRCITAGK